MNKKKRKQIVKIVLIAGLVWKWMPVLVARDGEGTERGKHESD